MNASVTFSLTPVPPFRLDLTAWALRRRPNNLIDRWDGETYRRVLVMNGYPAEVAVRQSRPAGFAPNLHQRKVNTMNRSSAEVFQRFLRAPSVPAAEGGAVQKPAIAISRQAGADAATVANLVAQQLDPDCPGNPPCPWGVFDRNLVEQILKDHHLSKTIRPIHG